MLNDNLRGNCNDMSQAKSKTKRPRGDKTPAAEILRRVSEVTDLLVEGKSRPFVVAYCRSRFKVSDRTATEYIARAMKELSENFKHDVRSQSEIALIRYQSLFEAATAQKKYKDAALVQDRICKLLGLWTEKVEVEVDDWRSKLIREIRAKEVL